MDIYFWKCTILSVNLGYFQLHIVGNLTNCIKTVLAPVSEASRDEISNGSSLKRAQLLSLSLSQLCSPPCVTFILWLTSPAAAAGKNYVYGPGHSIYFLATHQPKLCHTPNPESNRMGRRITCAFVSRNKDEVRIMTLHFMVIWQSFDNLNKRRFSAKRISPKTYAIKDL